MKKLSLTCLLSLATFSALAADTVVLKVTGTLVTGACTPSLDGGGIVDFGHIPLGNLSKTDENQLGSKNITLTITCDSSMPVGWIWTDNRADSLENIEIKNAGSQGANITASNNELGLGKTSDGVNIGAYGVTIDMTKATADGAQCDGISTQRNTTPYTWEQKNDLWSTNDHLDTASAVGSSIPLAFKSLVLPLKVTAAIQGTDTLAIADDTLLDGSTTISLVYL